MPQENNGDGAYNTVICSEEAPFTTPSRINAARDGAIPASLRSYFIEDRLELCRSWPVATAPAVANQVVSSNVPTLLLSGQINPVTPPAWAQAAAASLQASFAFELTGLSHITIRSACARSIIAEFLANPARRPAAGCLAQLAPVQFLIAP